MPPGSGRATEGRWMMDIDTLDHLRGPGLGHVFTDQDDPYDDVCRLVWMAVTAAGGELRLTPRVYPGEGLFGRKTKVALDPSTGELVLTVERVTGFG